MILATYITAGLYADWFGGINPPCRYLVALIPFLAVGLLRRTALGRGQPQTERGAAGRSGCL